MDAISIEIRLRSSEKLCPRCQHVLVLNQTEECIECHYCGYIDCGDDEHKLSIKNNDKGKKDE